MFCLRFAHRKSELFCSLGFLLIIIVPAFMSCHARAPGYTYTRMKTVSCVQTVVQSLQYEQERICYEPLYLSWWRILAEVIGTTLMKFSEGFTRFGPLLAQLFAIVHHFGY